MAVMCKVLLLALGLAMPACPQALEEAAARLAARIATIRGSAPGAIAVENRSSLPASAADRVRAILDRELHPGAAAGTSPVRVTISESISGPMLIAEAEAGGAPKLLIETFIERALPPRGARARLQLRPVLAQPEAMLDFALLGGTVAVLEPSRIALYTNGQPTASLPLSLAAPLPRDPRGRLLVREGQLEASLPGTMCTVRLQPDPSIHCKADEATAWREGSAAVAWAPRRNYLISPDLERATFYTAASLGSGRGIVATTDGALRLLNGVAVTQPAGSDLASVSGVCPALLLTAPGTLSDSLQAFEAAGAELRALSERLPLAGVVAALWTAETPAEASLIVHKANGEYEASRVTIDCDR